MNVFHILTGLLITTAHASSPFQPYCDALGNYCGSGNIFLVQLAVQASEVVFRLIIGVAVISIMIGGIKLITGAEGAKEDAKKIIQYALFGVAFAIVSFALVRYVCYFAVTAIGESTAMCDLSLFSF